jgi:DnaK suppressor protein
MQKLSPTDLKTFQKLLRAEKASILGEPRSDLDALKHMANVSEEDQAPLIHDQFLALHFRKHEHQKLTKIEIALELLSTGEYGICQACEEPISRKRLLAIPWADHCVPCQEQLQESSPSENDAEMAA